jgi:uncharacterized protein YdhG (YjbR/CyaY superfamily)
MLEAKPIDFEAYVANLPASIINSLRLIRQTIIKTNPEIDESISYGMPAFKYKGKPLAYFAAFKNHIGFYPTSSGVKAVESELSKFQFSKGAIQFPHNKKIPFALIKKIIKIRTVQIEAKSIPKRGKLNV